MAVEYEGPVSNAQRVAEWRRRTGGNAFPEAEGVGGAVTLRDYFAAAALTGILAGGDDVPLPSGAKAAQWAYEYADAMRAERERVGGKDGE